jgi:hypothetical protein
MTNTGGQFAYEALRKLAADLEGLFHRLRAAARSAINERFEPVRGLPESIMKLKMKVSVVSGGFHWWRFVCLIRQCDDARSGPFYTSLVRL